MLPQASSNNPHPINRINTISSQHLKAMAIPDRASHQQSIFHVLLPEKKSSSPSSRQ